MNPLKLIEVIIEIILFAIATSILFYMVALLMQAMPVPPGSPFDISGEIKATIAILALLFDVADIIRIYKVITSRDP